MIQTMSRGGIGVFLILMAVVQQGLCATPPAPYNQGDWPTLHHDPHNSDHLSRSLGSLHPEYEPRLVQWVLRESEYPMVSLLGGTIGSFGGVDVFLATPGKVDHANLFAFDLFDGALLWQAAPPTADESEFPGPGPCVTSTSTLLDDAGNIYTSDCSYIYCYRMDNHFNSLGEKAWAWRTPLPNLRVYDPDATPFSDQDWFPTNDPQSGITLAKPFVALVFTPEQDNNHFVAGVSVNGEIAVFDAADGSTVAYSHLEKNLNLTLPMNWGEPCDPHEFTIADDPMHFIPGTEDGMIPYGVWCTGSNTGNEVPPQPDPDLDYFMNPCQINAYLGANTGGVGSLITNTPAVIRDPDPTRPHVTRIYVPGAQTQYLSGFDTTPDTEDAILYRIDFDPTAPEEQRLTVMNNMEDQGSPVFDGRMADGENSAATPDVSLNEGWLVTADNQGRFYAFDLESGAPTWDTFGYGGYIEIGNLLSTATLLQRAEANGSTYALSFGDSMVWVVGLDPDNGTLRAKPGSNPPEPDIRAFDYRDYILENLWRPEPAYQQDYGIDGNDDGDLNDPEDVVYERVAVAASILAATDDVVLSVYSVGWHEPGVPAAFFIPTHSVLLLMNLDALLTSDPALDPIENTIEAAFIDTRGTSESGIIPGLTEGVPRGIVIYGSQSTSLAQFMDVNDMMVDEVKPLYLKPEGGLAILEFIAQVRQLYEDWPLERNVLELALYLNVDPD